ncbi:MAG: hypothetical protein KY453_06440, partial [Gemmatimonadetes bacterium]|nr:hypothetical protein [Gemmatimonadota bacterium]
EVEELKDAWDIARGADGLVLVGRDGGRISRSTDGGASWADLATGGEGRLSVAVTGRNAFAAGKYAILRSTDAGETWTHLGLEETRHVGRIVVHPADPDVVYVAAVGHLFGPNEERGVYKSTDGGRTWEKSLYIDENTGAIDLVMDRNDPNTLFAAMYQRRRTPWGFSADGPESGIYRTLDGGETWREMTEGLPEGDKGRIGLDIHRRDGDLLYALVESNPDGRGLYRSTDRGESWEKMSDRNPRPMYFSLVRIDPSNPERIYLGGVQFSISDDGGRTWWPGEAAPGVHLDHHALWVSPHDPDLVITGNDGGVATSRDGGQNWLHHHNVAAGQFYQIDVDSRDPYWICGGLQDNNSWCGPSRTLTDEGRMTKSGPRNKDWVRIWGGDGFWNVIDPTDPGIIYSESQNGRFGRYHAGTTETASLQPTARPTADDEEREYRWHWNTPLHVSHHDPATVFAGANHLMRSRDRGHSWEEASPDLTRQIDRDTLPIMGQPVDSTTLSRHDGVSYYGTISEIGESPLDAAVLYAGTDDGMFWRSRDGGATWTDLTGSVPGLRHGMWVSGIEPSHHVPGRVYLTFDGHKDDDYRPYVLVSENFGDDWRSITEGLPDDASVNAIREHPRTPGLVFLGNEVGLYLSTDRGQRWSRLTGNFPTVPVDDMRIHPRDNDLVIATHGRSIWILDDVTPLEQIARGDVLARDAVLFDGQRGTQWVIGGGPWFVAGEFIGDNPPEGASLRYWLRQDLESPVQLEVLEPGGGVLRTLEGPGEAGIQTAVWDLRADGPGEDGGGNGPLVLPGTYAVRLTAGDATSTADVVVRQDPRVDVSRAVMAERQDALTRLHGMSRAIESAESAIDTAQGRIEAAREALERAGDGGSRLLAEADSLAERLEAAAEALDEASAGRLAGAIEGIHAPPTADQVWQIERAQERVADAIRTLNTLLTDDLTALESRIYQPGAMPRPLGAVALPPASPM